MRECTRTPRTPSLRLALGACAALGLFACTSGGQDQLEATSVSVESALISAEAGGVIEIDASEHQGLAGTRIQIPAGALTQDTRISVAAGILDVVGSQSSARGPVADFGPDGTQFSKPVRISIPWSGTFDSSRARVFVKSADGSLEVLGSNRLVYDGASHTVSFDFAHFTSFQCGESEHPSPCSSNDPNCSNHDCEPSECGPAPALPNVQCPDGTIAGPGECRRNADGTCGWEIIECPNPHPCENGQTDPACPQPCDDQNDPNCQPPPCSSANDPNCPPRDCTPDECGPAPALPTVICPDGTIAGPGECRRNADGTCGWEIIECPNPHPCENGQTDPACPIDECDPSECGPAPGMSNIQCPDGTVAGPGECRRNADGTCAWEIIECPSSCLDQNLACPDGQTCDPNTGHCVSAGEVCGNAVCPAGTLCCNASCGMCAPPGVACTQQACVDPCDNVTCPRGEHCDPSSTNSQNGPVCVPDGQLCGANECGPAPGLANWICQDGSVGGPTGLCLRDSNGQCGWEINWCEPVQCSPNDPSCHNQCDPNTGSCGEVCGDAICGAGTYCCNESCGICAPLGGACTQQYCN